MSSVFFNPYVVSALCTGGGYLLNKGMIAINQVVAKRFALPLDLFVGLDYNEYTDQVKQTTDEQETDLTNTLAQMHLRVLRHNGLHVVDIKELKIDKVCTFYLRFIRRIAIPSVVEGIVYQNLIPHVLLPLLFPQVVAYPFVRMCLSTVLFAIVRSRNLKALKENNETRFAGFCHMLILATTCAIAREKLGLVAAIFTHVGFNLYQLQYDLNLTFSDFSLSRSVSCLTGINFCFIAIGSLFEGTSLFILHLIATVVYTLSPFLSLYAAFQRRLNHSLEEA